MFSIVAIALIVVFAALALVHLYWMLGGVLGKAAAVPEVNDRLAFVPSKVGTLAVVLLLPFCAILIAALGDLISSPLPHWVLAWLSYGLAIALLLRAVGDFRLVGFFKKVRGTAFARRDTMFYTPLCIVLAVGVGTAGYLHGA